jgi:hypothetical protein
MDRHGKGRLSVVAVLGLLFLVAVWRVALSWRYFDRFMWDDGWFLQVARRVAAGESLYRDVAWDYGPFPVYVLGLLLRLSPSVVWLHLLDILLVASALVAVYVAGRSVASRKVALTVTAWAALLGGSVGLISHLLDAYTPPVAWGTSCSLAAAAAACVWVGKRSPAALAATTLFAVLALLSKPEYGFAGCSVLGAALWLRRPQKRCVVLSLGGAVVLLGFILLRADSEVLAAVWRGYSGYDLIAVGSVPVLDLPRLFGGLLAAVVVGAFLWWATRVRSLVMVGGSLAASLLVLALASGERFLHTAGIVCQMAWIGTIPAVLWAAWVARRAAMPAGFWILCVYSVAVGLRWFLLGVNGVAAGGSVMLVFYLLVRHRVLRPPTTAGWLVLAVFLLFSSVESELRSLRWPTPLEPVTTALGTVRLPARVARNVQFMQDALAAAPEGGLFVAGGGPGWYLVSDRPNPTRFDAIWFGLGTTEPEAGQILDDLRADPPAAVLVERDFRIPDSISLRKIWAAAGQPESSRATTPDGRWTLRIVKPR